MDEVTCPRILWGCPHRVLVMAIFIAGACLSIRWGEQDLRRAEQRVQELQTRAAALERQLAHLNNGE